MTDRVNIIHTLRGLAAIGVAWYHFAFVGNLDTGWFGLTGKYGNLGVQVFFVISGFILPYSLWKGRYRLSDFWRFLLKRVARLDPPCLVAIALAIGIGYLAAAAPGYRGEPYTVTTTQLLLHLAYLNVYFGQPWLLGVLWTLAIEVQFYIILGLIYPLLATNRRFQFVLFAFACGLTQWAVFKIQYMPYHWPLFLLGIAVFRYKAGFAAGRETLLCVPALILYCALTLGGAPAAAGALSALSILFVSFRSRWTDFLGDISYSLYLIHQPFGNRICNLGGRFATKHWQASLVAILALAVTVGMAYLMYRYVERPSQRLAKRIQFRNRDLEPAPRALAATAAG